MKISYRPEIDGLRAFAVLAVIFYHAEFTFFDVNPFSGGYIGVDVFFVISGYLITSIILQDLQQGKFSFLNFFERRARRILPVLFTVLLASIPLAWMTLLPKAMKEYAASALSSLAFVSNFWFWKEDSYWAEPSALKPFLHTWSLSVEIQFYILFPVLLFLLWRYATRLTLPAMLFLAAISLLAADRLIPTAPEFTFFLLPTRVWELLAGAVLAKLMMVGKLPGPAFLWKIAPAIGLGMIAFSVTIFDAGTLHPSLITLLPVAGTLLIIGYSGKTDPVTRVLQNQVTVGVGLISYSFYLWHFPIFAFSRITNETPSLWDKVGWIAITLLLTVAGYFTIEKPFRRKKSISTKFLGASVLLAIFILVPANWVALATEGKLGRFEEWQLRFMGEDESQKKSFTQYVISRYNEQANGKPFGGGNRKKLLLIGDSYSQDFYNLLAEAHYLDDIDTIASYIPTKCANSPSSVKDQLDSQIPEKERGLCRIYHRVGDPPLNEKIKRADGVIVITAWDDFTGRHALQLRNEIISLGAQNVLFVGRKNFPILNSYELLSMNLQDVIKHRGKIDLDFYQVNERMKQDFSKGFLDLHQLVCGPTPACPVSTPEGFLISYDGGHLTREGALYIAGKLEEDTHFNRFWDNLMHG